MSRLAAWVGVACAAALFASVVPSLPAGAVASVGSASLPEAVYGAVPADGGVTASPARLQVLDDGTGEGSSRSDGVQGDAESGIVASVLGDGFVLTGTWLAPGLVGLDWDGVAAVSGYELLANDGDGWLLLAGHEPVDGVVAVIEGSSARVGGLSEDAGEYWFAVRARSTGGPSSWSASITVAVPEGVSEPSQTETLFDPFTEPTLSGIDLAQIHRWGWGVGVGASTRKAS